jgi:hypothetical protein
METRFVGKVRTINSDALTDRSTVLYYCNSPKSSVIRLDYPWTYYSETGNISVSSFLITATEIESMDSPLAPFLT